MVFKKKKDKTLKKLAVIIPFCIIISMAIIKLAPRMISMAENPKAMADYLSSFGYAGFLIFILLEIFQVVIALIPGDLFHIAAGLIYKMPLGFILAYTGEVIGALIAFGLARYYGSNIVRIFVKEDKINRISMLINSAKGTFGILVLCLIPAIPKDILLYVAGITPVKPFRFLLVFLLCRIPDIFIKSSGGAAIYSGNHSGIIIVIAAFLIFAGVGLLLKKKFIKTGV